MSVDLDRLQAALLQSGIQIKNQPLYQVINQLIQSEKDLRALISNNFSTINNIINNITLEGTPPVVLFGDGNNDPFDPIPIPGKDGKEGKQGLTILALDGLPGEDAIPIPGTPGPKGDIGLIGPPGMDGGEGSDLYQFLIGSQGTSTPTAPAGSDTYVQFNDSGVFGGDSGLRFNKTTNDLIITGVLDISDSTAGQIAFPSTQHASSNGNTLDDYERGTWTPTGHNITFSSAFGRYIKIGKLVYASFNVTFPVTTNATYAAVESLPFTAVNAEPPGSAFLGYNVFGSFITFNLNSNTSFLVFTDASGNNINNITVSTKQFVGVAIYEGAT